jgi:hypothetical protein
MRSSHLELVVHTHVSAAWIAVHFRIRNRINYFKVYGILFGKKSYSSPVLETCTNVQHSTVSSVNRAISKHSSWLREIISDGKSCNPNNTSALKIA